MNLEVIKKHNNLSNHQMYQSLVTLDNIKVFMKYHVFAVWDFMSLLKSLQKEVTCINVPWTDSKYGPEAVRLINEIVLGEESDIDQDGHATSHFALYLKAMKEVGADSSLILEFINDFKLENLPIELQTILSFHLDLAKNGKVHEVASSFFYGRENLIPEMFKSIVDVLKSSNLDCRNLIYYFERHIELDSEDHGPKALKCLNKLIDSERKKEEAIIIATRSLDMRWRLWDFIQKEIEVI